MEQNISEDRRIVSFECVGNRTPFIGVSTPLYKSSELGEEHVRCPLPCGSMNQQNILKRAPNHLRVSGDLVYNY